jgi:hypothetical protein
MSTWALKIDIYTSMIALKLQRPRLREDVVVGEALAQN